MTRSIAPSTASSVQSIKDSPLLSFAKSVGSILYGIPLAAAGLVVGVVAKAIVTVAMALTSHWVRNYISGTSGRWDSPLLVTLDGMVDKWLSGSVGMATYGFKQIFETVQNQVDEYVSESGTGNTADGTGADIEADRVAKGSKENLEAFIKRNIDRMTSNKEGGYIQTQPIETWLEDGKEIAKNFDSGEANDWLNSNDPILLDNLLGLLVKHDLLGIVGEMEDKLAEMNGGGDIDSVKKMLDETCKEVEKALTKEIKENSIRENNSPVSTHLQGPAQATLVGGAQTQQQTQS